MSGTSEAAHRYGRALLEVAVERDRVDAYRQALGRVVAALDESVPLQETLINPLVGREAKVRVVETVAKSGDPAFGAFLRLLAAKGRMGEIGEVARAYRVQADHHEGIIEARVETAVKLTGDERDRIRALLEHRFRKTVRLVEGVRPGVLGGFRVVLEDEVLDFSLATHLRRLGQRLRAHDARELGEAL